MDQEMITLQEKEFAEFAGRVGEERIQEILKQIEEDCRLKFEYELIQDCKGKPFSEWPWVFLKLRALEYEHKHPFPAWDNIEKQSNN